MRAACEPALSMMPAVLPSGTPASWTVALRGMRISDQKRMWGTCGKDGIITIHWHLVQAPSAAMEYVVAHEVCHVKHRHHDPAFWRTLASGMPDWRERKVLLEAWERDSRLGHLSVF